MILCCLQFAGQALNFILGMVVKVRTTWSMVLGILHLGVHKLGTLDIHICWCGRQRYIDELIKSTV